MCWISVKDRLPSETMDSCAISNNVLGLSKEGVEIICYLVQDRFVEFIYSQGICGELEEGKQITHWKPLKNKNDDSDRKNLEWLVRCCLSQDKACISAGKGKELLGLQTLSEMREWENNTKEGV